MESNNLISNLQTKADLLIFTYNLPNQCILNIVFFLLFDTGIVDTKAIILQRCRRVQKECQSIFFEGRNGQ